LQISFFPVPLNNNINRILHINMMKDERSHKAWVRKHQPSYWSSWFGKKKKENKDNSKERGNISNQTRQGSRGNAVDDGDYQRGRT
jgi:hypothetical protein